VTLSVVVLGFAVVLLVVVAESLYRRRLSEAWAAVWAGAAMVALVLGVARPLVDRFATSLGFAFGTSLVFAVAIVFLVIVCIRLSMKVTQLGVRIEQLAQELALTELASGDDTGRPDDDHGDGDDDREPR
jgi:hypothetical protein